MELLYFTLICITVTLIVRSKGYCLYGDGLDCVFPCHCVNKTECTTGCQPTGCATGPLDIPWQGPGCQIGNVALGKTANETGSYWPADHGVDGRLPVDNSHAAQGPVCAHPNATSSQLAEWGVDLGGIYKISSVIIYNRLDLLYFHLRKRTSMFTISVRNSSVHEELCYDYNIDHDPGDRLDLTCNKPVIGRYIRFARKSGGYQPEYMNFCELIAIGHCYFDCSVLQCLDDTACNEVTGCESCLGSYPPDCLTACEAGSYGKNCQSPCGRCAGDDVCDKTTGYCPNDCDLWWAGQECQEEIISTVHRDESVSITESNSTTIQLQWQPLTMVSESLVEYYGYKAFFKKSAQQNYTEGPDVPHTTNPQATITGLVYNTDYHIEIQPYREMTGRREYGNPYPVITHKTECGEPEQPQRLNTVFIKDEGAGNYSLTIIFNPSSSINSRCDSIIQVWIEYRRDADVIYTNLPVSPDDVHITITGLSDGTYDVTLSVRNNQNKTSSSEPSHVVVGTTPVPVITTTMAGKINEAGKDGSDTVIIASVVAVVVVLAVVVSVTVVILLRRRKRAQSHEQNDNSTPVTTNVSDAVPLDEIVYENIDGGTGQQNTGEDNGQDNRTVELDDAGYTHLRK